MKKYINIYTISLVSALFFVFVNSSFIDEETSLKENIKQFFLSLVVIFSALFIISNNDDIISSAIVPPVPSAPSSSNISDSLETIMTGLPKFSQFNV